MDDKSPTSPPKGLPNRKNKTKPPKKTKIRKKRPINKKNSPKTRHSSSNQNHNDCNSPSKSNHTPSSFPKLPEPPNLEEEIRTIWSKPVDELPVYKDLPRLARRIVILGSLKPTLSSTLSDNEEEGENENNTNSQPSSQSQVINNDAGPTNSISVPPQSESPSFEAQIPQEVLIRFLIYLNTSPITTFRASNWPKTYKICNLEVYAEGNSLNIVIEVSSRDKQALDSVETPVCKCSIDNLRTVEDSSRYFVLQGVTSNIAKGIHNVGIAFYTREESARFKEVILKHSGREIIPIGNTLQETRNFSPSDLKKYADLSLEEKPIHEKQIRELAKETEKALQTLGSVRKNSETLNTLRDKVSNRLSKMGTGQIVYQEDEQLGHTVVKLVNIHKLQNTPQNLRSTTPRAPQPATRQKEHFPLPSSAALASSATTPRLVQPQSTPLSEIKLPKMSSDPELLKTDALSDTPVTIASPVSSRNKDADSTTVVQSRKEKAMSFSTPKSDGSQEKRKLPQFAPVTAETLDKAKDSQTLIDLNLPRGPSPLAQEAETQFNALIAIKKVIMGVAQQVEEESKQKEIETTLTKIFETSYHGELELLVKDLFTKTIGKDSKTARIFKAIHQGIIHSCTYQIKAKVTPDILTGDVRGPEGWQILILFANDVISISHRRRERSIDLTGPKDKFWFEWALHMTFDKDLKDLNAAVLKIVDLQISGNVDNDEKEKIKQS